jgi:hypothetical protein
MGTVAEEDRIARRKKFIERFARKQEIERRFIRLSEAIEFNSIEENSVEINDDIQRQRYELFISDVLDDRFIYKNAGQIKYYILRLSEMSPARRIDSNSFAELRQYDDSDTIIAHHLYFCWIPRQVLFKWCKDYDMKIPPAWHRARARELAKPSKRLATELAERETAQRGIEQKQEMIKKLFADVYWPVHRALRWIAFRDPALIAHSLWPSIVSNVPPMVERDPYTTLIRALQEGRILAYPHQLRWDTWVSRKDVLSEWNELGKPFTQVADAPPALGDDQLQPPKEAQRPTKVEACAAWLREAFPNRPALTVDELMRRAEKHPGIGQVSKRTFEAALKKVYGNR